MAPVTRSPGPTSTGHGLAGEHRLVHGAAALDDDAVGGDGLARADDEQVAAGELRDRDALLAGGAGAVAEHRDVLGAQVEQGPQGGAGAALGAGLEPAADEHGGRDDGGDLEVDLVAALARAR